MRNTNVFLLFLCLMVISESYCQSKWSNPILIDSVDNQKISICIKEYANTCESNARNNKYYFIVEGQKGSKSMHYYTFNYIDCNGNVIHKKDTIFLKGRNSGKIQKNQKFVYKGNILINGSQLQQWSDPKLILVNGDQRVYLVHEEWKDCCNNNNCTKAFYFKIEGGESILRENYTYKLSYKNCQGSIITESYPIVLKGKGFKAKIQSSSFSFRGDLIYDYNDIDDISIPKPEWSNPKLVLINGNQRVYIQTLDIDSCCFYSSCHTKFRFMIEGGESLLHEEYKSPVRYIDCNGASEVKYVTIKLKGSNFSKTVYTRDMFFDGTLVYDPVYIHDITTDPPEWTNRKLILVNGEQKVYVQMKEVDNPCDFPSFQTQFRFIIEGGESKTLLKYTYPLKYRNCVGRIMTKDVDIYLKSSSYYRNELYTYFFRGTAEIGDIIDVEKEYLTNLYKKIRLDISNDKYSSAISKINSVHDQNMKATLTNELDKQIYDHYKRLVEFELKSSSSDKHSRIVKYCDNALHYLTNRYYKNYFIDRKEKSLNILVKIENDQKRERLKKLRKTKNYYKRRTLRYGATYYGFTSGLNYYSDNFSGITVKNTPDKLNRFYDDILQQNQKFNYTNISTFLVYGPVGISAGNLLLNNGELYQASVGGYLRLYQGIFLHSEYTYSKYYDMSLASKEFKINDLKNSISDFKQPVTLGISFLFPLIHFETQYDFWNEQLMLGVGINIWHRHSEFRDAKNEYLRYK